MQIRNTVQSENPGKTKGFTPATQQAQIGDNVFWFNEDRKTSHQPYPSSGKAGDWGPPVTAQNSSEQVNLDKAGTYPYQCAIHPAEKATLIVANPMLIAPAGGGGAAFSNPNAGGPPFNTLTIPPGQCVSWGNSDSQPHQPVLDAGGSPWFAQPIKPGDISAQITFPAAGNFSYHCALHPNEKGVIVVKSS